MKPTAEERLIAEQVVLSFRSLNKACDDAKDGIVLAVAERLALIQGRKLIQQTLKHHWSFGLVQWKKVK